MPLACLVALMDDAVFDVRPGAIKFDSSRKYVNKFVHSPKQGLGTNQCKSD